MRNGTSTWLGSTRACLDTAGLLHVCRLYPYVYFVRLCSWLPSTARARGALNVGFPFEQTNYRLGTAGIFNLGAVESSHSQLRH